MKLKNILIGVFSATLLSTSVFTTLGFYPENARNIIDTDETRELIPIICEVDFEQTNYFSPFKGIVKEITDFEGVEGSKFVLVENEEGMLANLIVSNETYIVGEGEIEIGSTVTGYYDPNVPVIMIYPNQYKALVLVINQGMENIKVDFFNEDLIDTNNFLKLNISDETEIISQDGYLYQGELANKKLVVIYDFSTKSIPAQTTPRKIIVLESKEEEVPSRGFDVSGLELIVNDEITIAPSAYVNEADTVMLPLRAIAEALGYEVKWEGEARRVIIGNNISLTIAEDKYIYEGKAPFQLGDVPELINGTTFVPLSFFRDVMGMNNAYIFEGQIVIDNGEKMY